MVGLTGCELLNAPTGPVAARRCPFILAVHDTVIVRLGQPWHVSDTARACL